MSINIGENIKKLRKQQDLTQERLAEYVNVSHQAVSKWESGETLPDVTLLPVLSTVLGVSIDSLYGIDASKQNAEIDAVIKKVSDLFPINEFKKMEDILREALMKYPRNYKLMNELANTLWAKFNNEEEKENVWIDEAISIYYRILQECTEDEIRFKAKSSLAICLELAGRHEKAIEIAKTIPVLSHDVMLNVLEDEDKYERCQADILQYIVSTKNSLDLMAMMNCNKGDYEGALYFLDKIVKLLELFLEDIDEVMLSNYSRWYCYRFAYVYAQQGDYENALVNLKKYVKAALDSEKNPDKYHYKSRMFNRLEHEEWSSNHYEGTIKEVNEILKEKWFEPLRGNDEFKDLEKCAQDLLQNRSGKYLV